MMEGFPGGDLGALLAAVLVIVFLQARLTTLGILLAIGAWETSVGPMGAAKDARPEPSRPAAPHPGVGVHRVELERIAGQVAALHKELRLVAGAIVSMQREWEQQRDVVREAGETFRNTLYPPDYDTYDEESIPSVDERSR